jgi:hypothetical protein
MAAEVEPSEQMTADEATIRGVQVGADDVPRVKLINPRRWPKVQIGVGLVVLKCPYCLSLIADPVDGDEHLWRIHADNRHDRAGQMWLLPLVLETKLQVMELLQDMARPTGFNGLERHHSVGDYYRNRRRFLWRRWRYATREPG